MRALETRRSAAARFVAVVVIAFVFCSMGGGAGAQIGTGGLEIGYGAAEEGDLFVGAISENDGWGAAGVIKRVRGGSVSTYCESTFVADSDFWRAPHDVLVDSQGRVVFLAQIGPLSYTHGVYALLRCSEGGRMPEKLAVFGVGGPGVPVVGNEWRGYPVPFPDLSVVGNVAGLHLARKTAVVIDDGIAQGKPEVGKEDVYVMVISTPSAFKSVAYRPATGEWADGPRIVDVPRYIWSGSVPDATYYGGATYSTLENVVGRDREPFRIDLKGTIRGVYFGLRVGLFGGYSEVGGGLGQGSFEDVARTSFVLDNVLIPNEDGGCPPGAVPTAVPRNGGGYNVPSGFREIAEHSLFGLVVTSNSSAAFAPYLTQFGGVLLDDNPFNDGQALFRRPELNCNAQRKVDFEPILPFWDSTGASNEVTRMVSGKDGLFGTQWFSGRVVQIRGGDTLTTRASGLITPTGIAAYPANVPPGSNIAIVIRIDSPVNVLVTDAAGRRIGVGPSGGIVNDFGEFGYVGEPGEPRILAIREPASGSYSVDTFGTGDGPYGVHVYSIDTSREEGEHIVTRGTAAPGSTGDHAFTLADTGAIAFHAAPPPEDAIAPTTIAGLSSAANVSGWHRSDVTVTLAATDEEGGSGVKEIVLSASGAHSLAQTTTAGGQVSIPLNAEGVTTVSYFARDNAGNAEAARTLTIMIDKTPPQIAGLRSPAANPAGWNTTDVTVTFACADEVSGIATCEDTPQVVTAEGSGQSRTARAVDHAGNEASAIVGMINIDRTAPSATCGVTPAVLWPANHGLVEVRSIVEVSDLLSGSAGVVLLSAASSEPDDAEGDGDGTTTGDVRGFVPGSAGTEGWLRAERAGSGPGRTYTLTYRARDRAGNTVDCAALAEVPHNSRR